MSDDPSFTDTATLLTSLRHDMEQAQAKVNEAYRWLAEARNTLFELQRREEKKT